jgi:hypothetical protein
MARVKAASVRFVLAAILSVPFLAAAMTFVINPPPSEVGLQVGGAGGAVTTVGFALTAANAGTGVAIPGVPATVLVAAWARQTGCAVKNASLTVTTPANLTSGANTIPFSTISWTATDADVASGTYASPGTVTLATFTNCRLVANNHAFSFANVQVYPSGTYNGTATYTVTMP